MVVWSVGEVLWDVFPDQERFGGAPLNFCANLQRLGDRGVLFSGVGKDDRGRLALERMHSLGLDTRFVCEVEGLPTGVAIISTAANGESAYWIPRPAAFDRLAEGSAGLAADAGRVDWLYFGTLAQTGPATESFVTELVQRLKQTRVFYDMNLRTGHWNLALVQRLSRLATVIKMNEHEAEILFGLTQAAGAAFTLEDFCRTWASEYNVDVICVTLGAAGCLVYEKGTITRAPGFKVTVRDTVGSGDAFAAAFVHCYDAGWPVLKIARFANALGALVASRAGATPPWTAAELFAISADQQDPLSA
jgi:fructokinase